MRKAIKLAVIAGLAFSTQCAYAALAASRDPLALIDKIEKPLEDDAQPADTDLAVFLRRIDAFINGCREEIHEIATKKGVDEAKRFAAHCLALSQEQRPR